MIRFAKRNIFILLFFILVSSLFAENARDFYSNGQNRFQAGDYFGAADLFKEALRINPSYFEAYFALSNIYFILEEYDKSLEYILEAERLNRRSSAVLVQKGRIYVGLDNLVEAEAIFNEVLQKEPLNLEAKLGLAEIALLSGHFHQAETLFRQSLYQLPESRRALLSLVLLYDNRKDFATAQQYLDSALRIHALNPQVHRVAALHYLSSGHIYEALYHAEELNNLQNGHLDSLLLLGRVLLELGRFEDAENYLEDSLRMDRSNPQIWYLMSQVYFGLDEEDKAFRALRKVLDLDVQDEISRIILENELVQRNSSNTELRDELAKEHFRRGWEQEQLYHYEKALREYRRGIFVSPGQYRGWIAYSRILLKMGFPRRSLNKLYAVKNDEYEDGNIDEEIERLERTLSSGLAEEWGVDQFSLKRNPISVSIFSISGESGLNHYQSEKQLMEYLRYFLVEDIRIISDYNNPGLMSYSEAYRMARSQESDFFVIASFFETERTFGVHCRVYLSRTGTLIKEYTQIRTGNGRVEDSFNSISGNIQSMLPLAGILIQKNQNMGLLNLGSFNNVQTGQIFQIVKPSRIQFSEHPPHIMYSPNDVLGTFEVVELDEEIALGKIEYASPFDLVNTGDTLIYIPEGEELEESDRQEQTFPVIDPELREQLLKIY